MMMFVLYSCDFCENTAGPGNEGEAFLYITAFPEESDIPGVFKYDIDNMRLTHICDNAIIYSPPSENGDLLIYRKKDGVSQMLLRDASGTEELLQESNTLFDISTPKLSRTGDAVVFFGGDNALYIYDTDDKAIDKVSGDFEAGFGFALSPDGKYTAFIEKEDSEYVLKIIETEVPDKIFYQNRYFGISPTLSPGKNMSWSKDGSAIVFTCRADDTYCFFVDDLSGSPDRITLSKDLGGFCPVLSSDASRIGFASEQGEIRIYERASGKYSKVTDNGGNEVEILQLLWSRNSDKIYYIEEFFPASGGSLNSLFAVPVGTDTELVETKPSTVVCNNVFNVFGGYPDIE